MQYVNLLATKLFPNVCEQTLVSLLVADRPPPKRIRTSASAGMNFLASVNGEMTPETQDKHFIVATDPFDGPQLPTDIWTLILAYTVGKSLLEVRNMVRLRLLQKGCAEASKSTNNLFWRRVMSHLWDPVQIELFEVYVNSYFDGYWFNLVRYRYVYFLLFRCIIFR
jgi:hypothetical protein